MTQPMQRDQLTTIVALSAPIAEGDLEQLTDLLVDVVDGGASVSFMAGLTRDEARDWWRRTFASADARAIILAARDSSGIVGSVQLHPAWAPNQPHRADVAKLLVHQRARRRGLARALMADLEARAAANGFTLLVLDTCQGTAGRGAVPRARLDRSRRHPEFRAHAGWRKLRYGVFLQEH